MLEPETKEDEGKNVSLEERLHDLEIAFSELSKAFYRRQVSTAAYDFKHAPLEQRIEELENLLSKSNINSGENHEQNERLMYLEESLAFIKDELKSQYPMRQRAGIGPMSCIVSWLFNAPPTIIMLSIAFKDTVNEISKSPNAQILLNKAFSLFGGP